MTRDVAVRLEGVSKKFCRSLRRSMWYGVLDISRDLAGVTVPSDRLRQKEFWAVDDVTLDVHAGECLGVVGHNGAGKSTLLKMLNGIIRPDRGTIRHRGRLGALIEVGAGFHPQLSGRENIFINGVILGMTTSEVRRKLDEIIDFADIGDFLDTPVKFYSSGMFVRLGMAVALHTEPQILLIDEVFAVGDIGFQAKCFNKIGQLRRAGVTFILVSHNIHHIGAYSDRVLVMDHGRNHALDEPEPALAEFLQLMHDKRDAVLDEDIERLPNGSGRIRVDRVELRDQDDRPVEQTSATEPITLVIDYAAEIDCDDVELDIVIYSAGTHVFLQASNRMLGQPLHVKRGRGTIRVAFPLLPANGDSLLFTLALWAPGRHELFDWRRDAKIEVRGYSTSRGTNWLPMRFDVIPAAEAREEKDAVGSRDFAD